MKKIIFLLLCCSGSQFARSQSPWTNTTPNINNTNSGNVGIGTSSPSALLHIGAMEGYGGTPYASSTLLKVYQPFNSSIQSASIDLGMCQPHARITGIGSYAWNSSGQMAFSTMQDAGVTEVMRLDQHGNVGIGTTTPAAKLEVRGNLLFLTGSHQFYLNEGTLIDPLKAGIRDNGGDVVMNAKNNGKLFLNRDVNSDVWIESSPDGINNIEIATFKANGNVGIGTTTPQTKLAVNGDMVAKKVTVTLSGWPDYVFAKGFRLPALKKVKEYIDIHHHLPEMPSADSVEKNGLDLGHNQALLLKKLEELTLYTIRQEHQIEILKEEVKGMKKMQQQIDQLSALLKK